MREPRASGASKGLTVGSSKLMSAIDPLGGLLGLYGKDKDDEPAPAPTVVRETPKADDARIQSEAVADRKSVV